MEEIKKINSKDKNSIIIGITSFLIFYIINNFIYRLYFNYELTEVFNIVDYFINPHLSLNKLVFMSSLIITLIITMYMIYQQSKIKKSKYFNVEHGSAKWANLSEIRPFENDTPDKNIIISKNLKVNADFMAKSPQYARNKNILVIGGSGTGKTRFFVKPNLMQMYGSYIVTDPKGSLIEETGYMFNKNKYDIKVLNLKDLRVSMKYNPFFYINTELDILSFVNALMENTKGEGEKSGDDFWVNAERMYFQALIGYMMEVKDPDEQNINTLLELINMGGIDSEGNVKEELDEMFQDLEALKGENSFAIRQYKKFKQGAGDTLKSILISVSARTSVFDIAEIRDLLSEDELNLHSIAKKPTVFFIIIKDTDFTLQFIASILYTQLMDLLVNQADALPNSRFEKPIQFILDEFANTGKIPNFEKLIATIRSRNISAIPILQSKAQLEGMYQKKAEILIDNCDSYLFLGSKGKSTLKDLSEDLGKTSIEYETQNVSFDKGNKKSYSRNKSKTSRELMTSDELSRMDNNYCIYQLRGVAPFMDLKYPLEKHKNYHMLSDDGHANKFDIENYIINKTSEELMFDPSTFEGVEVFLLGEFNDRSN